MKLEEIDRRQFLRRLKDPKLQNILDAINAIRVQLPNYYLKMNPDVRPRVTKTQMGLHKVRFEVFCPLSVNSEAYNEISNYKYMLQDILARVFSQYNVGATMGEVAYDDEDPSGKIKFKVEGFIS